MTIRLLRGSLVRKYATVVIALTSTALLVSGGVQLYFSYQETKEGLLTLQREKAARAATQIDTYVQEIHRQLGSGLSMPIGFKNSSRRISPGVG